MSLNTVFSGAVDTIFTVFKDLVKQGNYLRLPAESGWEDSEVPTSYDISVIVNGLSQKEISNTKFYAHMNPTDTVIMVKGSEIAAHELRIRSSDLIQIVFSTYTGLFEIIDHETDPAEALFLILVREK